LPSRADGESCTSRRRGVAVTDERLKRVNAPQWLTERPIAHRGLHDATNGVVENTLRAAEAAIAGGFAIECDVQLSSDGEVFVFHDETLDRLTDALGPFNARSAVEINAIKVKGSGKPPPKFAEFLGTVGGRTPIVCELKSRFDGDWRIADSVAAIASSYDGPLALKSFDHDLAGYLGLRRPHTRSGDPCPLGIVAEGSYDDSAWDFLDAWTKAAWTDFDHYDELRPDFLSWNVDCLPHQIPFLMKELNGAAVMAWTVRTTAQREAARKWADQIVFEGDVAK
jgi:glycerophosphoryl diester phosphodiesterase